MRNESVQTNCSSETSTVRRTRRCHRHTAMIRKAIEKFENAWTELGRLCAETHDEKVKAELEHLSRQLAGLPAALTRGHAAVYKLLD
jgi:hypothetical protein